MTLLARLAYVRVLWGLIRCSDPEDSTKTDRLDFVNSKENGSKQVSQCFCMLDHYNYPLMIVKQKTLQFLFNVRDELYLLS